MSQFLPHRVITDLEAAQENFDAIDGYVLQTGQNLADVADPAASRTNLGLGSAAIRKMSIGNTSVAFAAATNVQTTVTHGLGTTPTSVVATGQGIVGVLTAHTDTFTSTTFRLTLTTSAALTATVTASWIAAA